MKPFASFALVLLLASPVLFAEGRAQPASGQSPRFRIAIAGMVHGHVDGFLRAMKTRDDVELVGVSDPDATLRDRKLSAAGISAPGFARVDEMLAQTKPEAVAIFSSTIDHPDIVEAAARHHVHAMMEKPLAVTVADGERIQRAAQSGGIHVIVNYETTWYPSLGVAWQVIKTDRAGGAIRKMVAMDGHEGPKEIGVGPEFLGWLTDPVKNGAGALFDFGCYGANLMTWLMDDARPVSVRALTQQLKPSIYPRVDDEATIVVEYPGAQGIIQASWNWPFGRKDLEIYAERAYAIATGGTDLRVRQAKGPETHPTLPELPEADRDSISYLKSIVRDGRVPEGRSSLRNNLIVTEILAAARESAKTGRSVSVVSK
jgi:predicted dehydrogenase